MKLKLDLQNFFFLLVLQIGDLSTGSDVVGGYAAGGAS